METFKNWAFSICCASVSGGIMNMLLPENSSSKTFKTILCVFFLCIVISPLTELNCSIPSFFEKNIDEESYSENKFIENSTDYIESELIRAAEEILAEENIETKDISVSVNISESGSIDINKFVLILSDIENIYEIENKIFQKTGVKPNITVLGEDADG